MEKLHFEGNYDLKEYKLTILKPFDFAFIKIYDQYRNEDNIFNSFYETAPTPEKLFDNLIENFVYACLVITDKEFKEDDFTPREIETNNKLPEYFKLEF